MAGKSTIAALNVLLSLDSSRFTRGLRLAQGRVSTFSKTAGKAMVGFASIATGVFTAGALALVAASAKAAAASYGFDKSITRMATQVGLSTDELDKMRPKLIALSEQYGVSAVEISDAMWTIQSGGIKGQDAFEALEEASKMAAIGMGDANTNAQAMVNTLKAYSASGIKAAEASNIMLDTVRYGQIPALDMAEVLGDLVDLSSQLGWGFDELGGTVASLSQTTSNSSKVTTQLKNIMGKIIDPAEESKEAMTKLGYSFDKLRELGESGGALAVFMKLNELMKGNATATAELFPNIKGLTGILSVLGDNWEYNAEIMAKVGADQNSLNRAVEDSNNSYSKQVDLMKNEWNVMFLRIGESMKSTGGGVVKMVRNIIGYMPKLYNAMGRAFANGVNWMIKIYNMSSDVRAVFLVLLGILKTLWVSIKALVNGTTILIAGLAEAALAAKALKFDDAKKALADMNAGLKGVATDFGDGMVDAWGNLNDEIAKGRLKRVIFNEISEGFGGATQAVNALKYKTPSFGDSKKTRAKLAMDKQNFEGSILDSLFSFSKEAELGVVVDAVRNDLSPENLRTLAIVGTSIANAFEGIFDAIASGGSIWKAMGQAIMGIVKKLLAAVAAAALLSILTGGMGSGAAGGGFKSLLKGMLNLPKLELGAKANGGRVSAGQPYMVGERGREMFVPSHSGRIVPHGTTNNKASGGRNNSLSARLSGKDIVLASDRSKNFTKRYGG